MSKTLWVALTIIITGLLIDPIDFNFADYLWVATLVLLIVALSRETAGRKKLLLITLAMGIATLFNN